MGNQGRHGREGKERREWLVGWAIVFSLTVIALLGAIVPLGMNNVVAEHEQYLLHEQQTYVLRIRERDGEVVSACIQFPYQNGVTKAIPDMAIRKIESDCKGNGVREALVQWVLEDRNLRFIQQGATAYERGMAIYTYHLRQPYLFGM